MIFPVEHKRQINTNKENTHLIHTQLPNKLITESAPHQLTEQGIKQATNERTNQP